MSDILKRHMEDLAARAVQTGMMHSGFLTPAEMDETQRQFARRRDVRLVREGGLPEAERAVAVFLEPWWGTYEAPDILCALRADWTGSNTMGHRDILGSLMALGVEREVFGDIVDGSSPAFVVCLRRMAPFVRENLLRIGAVAVRLTESPLSDIPARKETFVKKTVTVASLRFDAVVAEGFDIKRSDAAAMITRGLVMLNHVPCEKPERRLDEGDLMSIRGQGRVKILVVGQQSRKGRTFVELGRS